MEYFIFPFPTKKQIPFRFDGLEPEKNYKPNEILGNYEWVISCHSILPLSEGLKNKAIAESKLARVSFDDSNIISFEYFFSFLIKNYQGWVPNSKAMDLEKSKMHANKLLKSFLSCSPEQAIYVSYEYKTGSSLFSRIGLDHEPLVVNGIMGIFDTQNLEYFIILMGGYENYNLKCNRKIVINTLPQIIFCPIRKMPIEFHAYEFMNFNQGPIDEVGDYNWYLYQYRVENSSFDISVLEKDQKFRTSIPPVGNFVSSSIVPFEEFFYFLVKNYQGWAPYAKGMDIEKAKSYATKLIKSFLSCSSEQAVYVKYDGATGIVAPYLISGVYGIYDPINNEFFELIMGGTD